LICGDSFVRIEGDFQIGNSWINHGAYIRCKDNITIGDDCAVSWNVDIIDYDGHQFIHDGARKPKHDPIKIQDNVWIGYNSSVNKGVTIHEGSVIASNSTVTSDIPANTLAAGSPAEVVRENISWEH
jgi:acetyltransferase-like isoleucine patch superfamily enzyme